MARHMRVDHAKARREGALARLRKNLNVFAQAAKTQSLDALRKALTATANIKAKVNIKDEDLLHQYVDAQIARVKSEIETLEHRIENPNWKRDKKRAAVNKSAEETAEWLGDMAAANAV